MKTERLIDVRPASGAFPSWSGIAARRGALAGMAFAVLQASSGTAADTPHSAPADWPRFRGPRGDGVATPPGAAAGVPLTWSETENVRWKTIVRETGWSSPVVQDGRVWVTSATMDGREYFVICVDAASGRVLHDMRLFRSDNPEPLGNAVNCYAAPTPVAEPGRVYVHFGTYGTACLDAATGRVLWTRDDIRCRHYRGPGSSPILYGNLLVLTFDGVDVQFVTALDKRTGATVWTTPRSTVWNDLDADGQPFMEGDRRKSFSTPLVVEHGGVPLLLSLGSSAAFGYDARTGREIWKISLPGHTSSVSPVFGRGRAYIGTGHGKVEMWALRIDGRGDVSDTHVAWKSDSRDVPAEPSPVLVDDLLFMISNRGVVSCLEADTGRVVWSERLGGAHMASPVYADGRLYFSSSVQGATTVLRAGRAFEVLAVNELADGFMASPAVTGRALILRTKTHLYRIETPAPR